MSTKLREPKAWCKLCPERLFGVPMIWCFCAGLPRPDDDEKEEER